MIVLLDSGPLGMVTNPRATHENFRCKQWLSDLLSQEVQVLVPEITDYEVRRELLRARRSRGAAHLDQLKTALGYIPISTEAMLLAADLWAQARVLERLEQDTVVIATTNLRHLSRLTAAKLWRDIMPPTA